MKLVRFAAFLVAIGTGFSAPAYVAAQEAPAPARASTFQPFPGAVPATSLTPEMIGQDVVIVGKVERVVPSTGDRVPNRVILADREPAAVMIVYWPDAAPEVEGGRGPITVGTTVSARGKLSEYCGDLQMQVRNANEIVIEGRIPGAAGAINPRPAQQQAAGPAAGGEQASPGPDGYYVISDLPNLGWRMGADISFKGTIRRFQAPTSERAPNVIHVSDGGNNLQIVYWAAPGQEAPKFDKTGEMIYATGKLGTYRNNLQLRINDLEDLSYRPLSPDQLADVNKEVPKADSTTPASEGWRGAQPGTAHLERPGQNLEPGTIVPLSQIAPAHAGNIIVTSGIVRMVLDREDSKAVSIADGPALLTVRLPLDTEMKFQPQDAVTVMGKVVYNDLRAQPEVVVEDKQGIQISPR